MLERLPAEAPRLKSFPTLTTAHVRNTRRRGRVLPNHIQEQLVRQIPALFPSYSRAENPHRAGSPLGCIQGGLSGLSKYQLLPRFD